MHIVLSGHALERARLRNITFEEVVTCVFSPDSTEPDPKHPGVHCHKKLGDEFLLLLYFVEEPEIIKVVTLIKTSQIKRYMKTRIFGG